MNSIKDLNRKIKCVEIVMIKLIPLHKIKIEELPITISQYRIWQSIPVDSPLLAYHVTNLTEDNDMYLPVGYDFLINPEWCQVIRSWDENTEVYYILYEENSEIFG
ncbi:MAG: hypothetical protein ACTSPQ_15060 [Candidatus Helarchaeota archaeon]